MTIDPTIAALGGALIGAVSAVAGQVWVAWLQNRAAARRERLKLAVELGTAEHRLQFEAAAKAGAPARIPPLSLFVGYNRDLLEELAERPVTEKFMVELNDKHFGVLTTTLQSIRSRRDTQTS